MVAKAHSMEEKQEERELAVHILISKRRNTRRDSLVHILIGYEGETGSSGTFLAFLFFSDILFQSLSQKNGTAQTVSFSSHLIYIGVTFRDTQDHFRLLGGTRFYQDDRNSQACPLDSSASRSTKQKYFSCS